MSVVQPMVSIILPNLNNSQFLPSRFSSIFSQTFTNWELVVIDGYSSDGAWEFIQRLAKSESRMRIFQAPRDGFYAALNQGIKLSQGKYIYVATSDDTMTDNCLEKMVYELEKYPECDLCHCCLTIIDQEGNPLKNGWLSLPVAEFFGSYLGKKHIRFYPHDAVLYCCLYAVYTSLTQLLIRRSLFDKVGFFETKFGSQGDVEWGIKATLTSNTLHIPYYLATWRRHPQQASKDNLIESSQGRAILVAIVKSLFQQEINNFSQHLPKISVAQLTFCYLYDQLVFCVREKRDLVSKIMTIIQFLKIRIDVTLRYVFTHKTPWRFNRISFTKHLLLKQGISKNIKVLE